MTYAAHLYGRGYAVYEREYIKGELEKTSEELLMAFDELEQSSEYLVDCKCWDGIYSRDIHMHIMYNHDTFQVEAFTLMELVHLISYHS